MSSGSDRILEGAPLGPVAGCSLGEYLLRKMGTLPKDHVIQVDADTGAVQTVGELVEMSIRLSEGLKKLGLRENDVVGLLCRNCFEASAVVLATWLSGAAIAPAPGEMKAAELTRIFGVARPKFIFCEEEAMGTVASIASLLSTSPTVILVDSTKSCSHLRFQDVLAEVDPDSYRPRPVADPATQLVGILFSSGTSGLPKGVGITHRNLIFQDMNMEELLRNGEIKSFLQVSRFFWVTGVLMYLRSLTTGIRRVLLRETTTLNLLRAMERYKAESTLMAPSAVLNLVSSPEFDSFDVSSMKKVFVGGSPLTRAMSDRIKAKWKTAEIIHVYGTTESTGTITSNLDGKDVVSVGRVSQGVRVKVVDTNTGEALEANSLGEICMKSPGIMQGYVENEEATREAIDREGWYHTGDFGYYDETGQVFIVDRMKEMLKVMNYQVSPTEVENTILEVQGVVEVAVGGATSEGNCCLLMALVVKDKDSTVTEEDIHAHVADNLSDYKKLTGGVHFVESIPKTASGKIRRAEVNKLAQALYSDSPR